MAVALSKSQVLNLAVTVTNAVEALHPVIVLVKVKVAVPVETPVTTPALVTVATSGLELVQVPPVGGDKVIVLPTATETGAETIGKALTVATTAVLAPVVHPPEVAST